MTRLSIRWRLTFWYCAAMAVVLGVFSVILLLVTRQQLFARTDGALREELHEAALEVGLAGSLPELQEQVRARFFQHDIYDFLVTDVSGRVVFSSSALTDDSVSALIPVKAPAAIEFASCSLGKQGLYRIARSTVQSGLGSFTVQAVTSLRPLEAELGTLRLVILVLLPLGVVLALAGGHFLAGQALAPMQRVADAANSITISSLDRRIEVVNPHDELGHLATTLNSLIARLERAVKEIQRFTADASHEIRTPLAALRAEAESALRRPRSSEEYEQTLAVVVEEATRLGRLADQLLNLSRHDAGITGCESASLRLDALLHDVAEQLQSSAEARGVPIRCEQVEPCEIQGDDIRLSQVFSNVIENAVKYSHRCGQVWVRCRVDEQWAVIEVEDTGIGIAAEHVPQLFERFYRVDPSRQSASGGTGLGLSIARAAVLAHGGRIDVSSRVGEGTTITIRLPRAAAIVDESLQRSVR